jgi:spore coat protein U-like protein
MKRTLVTLTTLALIAIASPMFAANANTPLGVSATVSTTCTITTTPVNFGAYDTVAGTAVAATGTVNVACTTGASGLTIDLNTGLNGGSATVPNTRAMNLGTNYLNYDLYSDGGHTTLWSTGFAISSPINKNARAFTVYGLIAANQDVPAGAYADTVTAQINY